MLWETYLLQCPRIIRAKGEQLGPLGPDEGGGDDLSAPTGEAREGGLPLRFNDLA